MLHRLLQTAMCSPGARRRLFAPRWRRESERSVKRPSWKSASSRRRLRRRRLWSFVQENVEARSVVTVGLAQNVHRPVSIQVGHFGFVKFNAGNHIGDPEIPFTIAIQDVALRFGI